MKLHLNQEFTITNERTMDSMSPKTLGIPTIFITFKGVLDGQIYKTYIVEGFNNCKLWEDKWRGEPVKIEPWMAFIFQQVYGWVWKKTGLRRIRKVY